MERGWLLPHVVIEVFEILPSLADGDTSTAVIFVVFVFWIVATLVHVLPIGVFGATG